MLVDLCKFVPDNVRGVCVAVCCHARIVVLGGDFLRVVKHCPSVLYIVCHVDSMLEDDVLKHE